MCCRFPSIQDIKRTCSFDDLNIPVRVLCRWRINLFGIIFLPVIAWVILIRYIAMTNNVSFNPEEEILNESCYLSEYGCCEIKDYCWSNGVRLLIPEHHYYLNLPKEDPDGTTCPSFFPDLVNNYVQTVGWGIPRANHPYHGRCVINPTCDSRPTGENATYDIIRLPLWMDNEEGHNCPDKNTKDFVSSFNIQRYYEYHYLNYFLYSIYVMLILWIFSLCDNLYLYENRHNYKEVVTEP